MGVTLNEWLLGVVFFCTALLAVRAASDLMVSDGEHREEPGTYQVINWRGMLR